MNAEWKDGEKVKGHINFQFHFRNEKRKYSAWEEEEEDEKL